jgi:hypothetical protein
MRRRPAILLSLPLLLAGLPAVSHGADAPAFAAVQTVTGTVAAPTRFTNPDQGFPGVARRLYLAHPATNGATGFMFDVDPKTWGGAFRFASVSDATGQADLDIYFYSDLGTIGARAVGEPGLPVSTAEYGARGAGGDTGFIPAGSTKALVFTYNGVASSFTYEASAMPKIGLASGDLDVTVPDGAFVAWVNDTDDYAFVRRTASANAMPFSSGSGTASGLRKGEVFVFQVTKTGKFTYSAGTEAAPRTGTITVVPGPGVGTPAS